MFTTVALAFAISLPAGADTGKLSVSDVQFTYGYLGPKRDSDNYLPGEKVFVSYNINNMKLNANGRANFSISMEIYSPEGDLKRKFPPSIKAATNYFGGSSLPAVATGNIPLDIPPGTYKIKVSIVDRSTMEETSFVVNPKVLPKDFGIIHLEPSLDGEGKAPASTVGVIGESLFVNFAVVGFTRKDGQPDISATLRILDENGKATMPHPLSGRANAGVQEEIQILPLQFAVTQNRVGSFTIELKAKDELTGKESTVRFPVRVVER